jgi:hypothetical protein
MTATMASITLASLGNTMQTETILFVLKITEEAMTITIVTLTQVLRQTSQM